MTPIPFRTHPASVTLGEGLELTIAHLRSNPVIWGVPTVIYAIVAGALTWAVTDRFTQRFLPYIGTSGSSVGTPGSLAPAFDELLQELIANLPALIGFAVLLTIGGLALYWVAMALAVGGLPGRTMTPDRAISAGVRTIGLGILLAIVAIPVVVLVTALMAFVVRADAGWLLLLLIPACVVIGAYIALRLTFALYAIFDGVGIIDSLRLTWRTTDGAVLRILGWYVALGLVSFVISIGSNLITSTFATTLAVIGVILATALTTAFQFAQATAMAILYESQRMRYLLSPGGRTLPGGPVMPAAPAVAVPPVGPADPLQPPPPPAW